MTARRRRAGALLSVIGALVASLLVATPAAAEPPTCEVVDPEGTGVILLREGRAFPVTLYCDAYPASQQALQITVSTTPDHGTAGPVTFVPQYSGANHGRHEVVYDPEDGYVGLDAFTLTVSDGTESTDVVVDLEMYPNTAPECRQSSETRWGHAEVGTGYDWSVLCGDWDLQDMNLEDVVTQQPVHGSVQTEVEDTSDGQLLEVHYIPEPGHVGADTFRAGITDGDLQTVMEFRVHVADGPWCTEGATPLNVEAGRTGRLFTYCSDPDLTWPTNLEVMKQPSLGTLELDGAVVDYTADPDATGTDSFSYRMTSDLGASNVVTQTVEITPNAAPVCTPVTTATPRGTPVEVSLSCSDPDGDELQVAVTGVPDHGTLTPLVDGTVTYSPEEGYDGTDTFTFEAADFARSSGPTTVTVAVTEDVPPVLTLRLADQSPARAARNGLRVLLGLDEAVTADVVVRVPARTASRLDLDTRVIGRLTDDAHGPTRLTVPLTRRAARAVRDVRRLPLRVTVTATDEWGNATTKGRRAVLD